MRLHLNTTINRMRLKKLNKMLKQVNHYSERMAQYSDAELQQKTIEFQRQLRAHQVTLNDLLPEAYAVVREASRRILGKYHKDVQVLGAIVMHQGNIAEMQTGEGKTLSATMPLYLNALAGKSVFLITTNDYLAERDYLEMKPLYNWLGLSVSLGFVENADNPVSNIEKQNLYQHDIIYTTNGHLGFDYLIDNLADTLESKFLPELYYAIIDEVDSIILDTAQTPLVISGAPRVQSNLFDVVKAFVATLKVDQDFKMKKTKRDIWLTEQGIEKANVYFNVTNLYDSSNFDLVRVIHLSLRAIYLLDVNLDYIVLDGEIMLIDRITGRMLPGTKMQAGLNQALEAKEKLDISNDMSVMATITFQNLFMQFERFSGMTATGKLAEKEFFELYSKIVVQIPTARPVIREDLPDRVFVNIHDKNSAILTEVTQLHAQKKPVLLITRTAEAGQLRAVTVATSMAGRGTDIKLASEVYALGGLTVLMHEHMENSRIDRQLRGRAGRQGDPGQSQIFISLDDDLVERWSDAKLTKKERLMSQDHDDLSESLLFRHQVTRILTKAQRVAEEQGMKLRALANEFEKSMSIQRQLIYRERNRILESAQMETFNFEQIARDVFHHHFKTSGTVTSSDISQYIYQNLSFSAVDVEVKAATTHETAVMTLLMAQFKQQFAKNKQKINDDALFQQFLRKAVLKAIDTAWIEQVDYLQQLKANVNQRQKGQRNAMFEYHKVALESFNRMLWEIKHRIIRNVCLSMVDQQKNGDLTIHFP
ncbi:accessory Sec system translocase SecA2 [Staphylococcus intermedius]|uniref:preprotein translocase subunit SecA n=1 Tax=Staphylococcus intermedius TaxID=1285 RepID=UPI000BBC26A1|nr:DEAD/DEAH box helicase [Staphylococcus intermedius]PCF64215.1 accessory Sec system translocase SecA2 [Staphylococcus intermedius]PCF78930.1 accessory Sec system translocase SecA2 [Staphylococcus intermedius]PCF79902.1 accessory Sec system translocase SecA2 [Staphylococcus intermedius]